MEGNKILFQLKAKFFNQSKKIRNRKFLFDNLNQIKYFMALNPYGKFHYYAKITLHQLFVHNSILLDFNQMCNYFYFL